ncbi:unnamed protein product (mitochondrion) [Plasmodiophora brassicae]|uniref:DUF4218 domain-containing protein n=1 Tax=Plasmodiophora brassicae TaxID=37360 RepID=A0A3P3Y4Y2_PLABS|nr:unnamed protein product [Plasmodiophora brassicae]
MLLQIILQWGCRFLAENMNEQLQQYRRTQETFAPFMSECDWEDVFPIATSVGIDGARVTKWTNESLIPMLLVNLALRQELRCNRGFVMLIGLMPASSPKAVQHLFRRLQVVEHNIGFKFAVPFRDASDGSLKWMRLLHVHQGHDYVELAKVASLSSQGLSNACNRCDVAGIYCSDRKLCERTFKKAPLAARWASIRDAIRDIPNRFKSKPASASRTDAYSTGLVSGFNSTVMFVLCTLHCLLLNFLPRVFDIINFKGHRNFYIPPLEEYFGRTVFHSCSSLDGTCSDCPPWHIPVDPTRYPATASGTSLSKRLHEVLDSIKWPTGNGDRPSNCFNRSGWKGHNTMPWIGDFGIAVFFSLCNPSVLLNSLTRMRFWSAFFTFLHCANLLLSKAIPKSALDNIALEFRAALAEMEYLGPATMMTISAHSIMHIPDIVKQFGPIKGFVWNYYVERWMLYMKRALSATIGFARNIVQAFQVMSATARNRADYADCFPTHTGNRFTFGDAEEVDEQGQNGLVLALTVDQPGSDLLLSRHDRAWLHRHMYGSQEWCTAHAHPYFDEYRDACHQFAHDVGHSVREYVDMFRDVDAFDEWCLTNFGRRLLPTKVKVYHRAYYGNVLWRTTQLDRTFPRSQNDLVYTISGDEHYTGQIEAIGQFEFPGGPPFNVFICQRWWRMYVPKKLRIGNRRVELKLPRYITGDGLASGRELSPFFPINQSVPANVVLVPTKIPEMISHSGSNMRASFVCVLPRANAIVASSVAWSTSG